MKSKIAGIPLVLILLILGIIVPLGAFVYALHLSEMRELKRLYPVTVVKTVEKQVFVTPTIAVPTTKAPVKKLPVSTQSGQVK